MLFLHRQQSLIFVVKLVKPVAQDLEPLSVAVCEFLPGVLQVLKFPAQRLVFPFLVGGQLQTVPLRLLQLLFQRENARVLVADQLVALLLELFKLMLDAVHPGPEQLNFLLGVFQGFRRGQLAYFIAVEIQDDIVVSLRLHAANAFDIALGEGFFQLFQRSFRRGRKVRVVPKKHHRTAFWDLGGAIAAGFCGGFRLELILIQPEQHFI